MLKMPCLVAMTCVAGVFAASCKSTGHYSSIRADKKRAGIDLRAVAEKLSEEDKGAIRNFIFELRDHISQFSQPAAEQTTINRFLVGCSNQLKAPRPSFFDSHFGQVQQCRSDRLPVNEQSRVLAAISRLKRRTTFDRAIDVFNEGILPKIFDAVDNAMSQGGRDEVQLTSIVETASELARLAELGAGVIEWRPEYFNSVRYLNQIVITELSKENGNDVNWPLVKAAATARLDIFPLSPGDAGANPLVLRFDDPMYKLLYGPIPRGPAYWMMVAAVTLRLHTYETQPSDYGHVPEAVGMMSVINQQILLESQRDQTLIRRALRHLGDNYRKMM